MSVIDRLFGRRKRGIRLSWLTSDLAVSREPDDDEWPEIHAAGIRAVLDLRSEKPDNEAVVGALGLRYLRLPVEEAQPRPREDGDPPRDRVDDHTDHR